MIGINERIKAIKAGLWTPEMVVDRLIEAFDVLARTPLRIGPQSYGSAWPEMRMIADDQDFYDLSKLKKMDRAVYEAAMRRRIEALAVEVRTAAQHEEADRPPAPSAQETSRAEEALRWPWLYLRDHPLEADGLQLYCRCSAIHLSVSAALRQRCVTADGVVEDREAAKIFEERRDKSIQKEVRSRVEKADLRARARQVEIDAIGRESAEEAIDAIMRTVEEVETTHSGLKQEGQKTVKVRRQDVMPNKVLTRRALDSARKSGAQRIAKSLNKEQK